MKMNDSSLDKKSDLKILKLLVPYLWPQGKKDLKVRVIVALLFLTMSKVTNVYMPVLYKSSIDALGLDYESFSFLSLPILLIFV